MSSRRTPWPAAGRSGAVLLGAGLLVAVRLRDPHVPGSWGLCPVLLTTGMPCPTCGGLRALADLVAGRPTAAFAQHAYLVVSLALVVAGGIVLAVRARSDRPGATRHRRGVRGWLWPSVAWLTGLVLFGVVRALTPAWWPPLGAA